MCQLGRDLLPPVLREPMDRLVEVLGQIFRTFVCVSIDGQAAVASGRLRPGCFSAAQAASEVIFHNLTSQEGVLVVPLCSFETQKVRVIVGPFVTDAPWISGVTDLKDSSDVRLSVTVPRQALTASYIATVFETFTEIAHQTPDHVGRASDDTGLENIRRIGAALAKDFGLLGPEGELSSLARSFSRVRPLRDFVNQLAKDDAPEHLTRIFQDLTARLPVGFHLVDLLGRSLIRPTKYNPLCRDVFRQRAPLKCVLSDLQHFWRAILQHRVAPSPDTPYEYRCHGGFTEILCPIFADELAVGAIFGGQIVESVEQQEAILSRAKTWPDSTPFASQVWTGDLEPCDRQMCREVARVCNGLAGLTGATFRQWCRAESESGLRAGLIEASQAPTHPGRGNDPAHSGGDMTAPSDEQRRLVTELLRQKPFECNRVFFFLLANGRPVHEELCLLRHAVCQPSVRTGALGL